MVAECSLCKKDDGGDLKHHMRLFHPYREPQSTSFLVGCVVPFAFLGVVLVAFGVGVIGDYFDCEGFICADAQIVIVFGIPALVIGVGCLIAAYFMSRPR